jgi:hypothetical protein
VYYEGEVQQERKQTRPSTVVAGTRASQQLSEGQPTSHGGA